LRVGEKVLERRNLSLKLRTVGDKNEMRIRKEFAGNLKKSNGKLRKNHKKIDRKFTEIQAS
jgi:hypothetical protein